MAKTIERPIFIVSPHRSGSTLLYRMLGAHPDTGYFTRMNRRLPGFPRIAWWMTRLGVRDDPMEAQRIWDRFRRGNDDRMGAREATPAACAWYRRLVATVLALRGARRFVAKYPRLSLRISWLDAVFPDALFLHLSRDWRAVVSSTVKRIRKRRDRGGGWFGVRIPEWASMESLEPEIVAGRVFRHVTSTLEREGPAFGDRYFHVRYEDLCARPRPTVRAIASWCGLRFDDAFEELVPAELRSANGKWRTHLDPAKIDEIRAEAPDFFARHEVDEEPAEVA